jgi:nitrile hydratase accessory protein
MPLPPGAPEPAFSEPWHAQLFALTVTLSEDGHFSWPDWAARFASTLELQGLDKELDGGDDYFEAWLSTLETLLAESGQASTEEASLTKAAWEEAYLNTPHGAPVRLPE